MFLGLVSKKEIRYPDTESTIYQSTKGYARYIAVNDKYDFLPKQLEDKGMTIVADIAQVLRDARDTMDSGDNDR